MASTAGTQASFIIVWGIENFIYSVQTAGQELVSPMFTVDSLEKTSWRIVILPRGDGKTNYVSCFLLRSDDDNGPESITITCKISVLLRNSFESTLGSHNGAFVKGGRSDAYSNFLSRDVFGRNHGDYLPRDTLTIRVLLWNSSREISLPEQIFAHTYIRVQRTSFIWELYNLHVLELNKKESIVIKSTSEQFPSLTMRAFWADGFISRDKVSFEISQSNLKNNTFVVCNISVLKGTEVAKSIQGEHYVESTKDDSWNIPDFFSESTLKYASNGSDISRLWCECVISIGEEQNLESNFDSPATTIRNGITHDFQCLLENGMFSDFKISVQQEEFNVHKVVLAARSSVFAAMFKSDTKEKSNNCVTFQDLDKDTVRLMLTFIYTDVVQDLQWETGLKLYQAADKYIIHGIKQKCSTLLIQKLSTLNVCEALVWADMLHDVHLKAVAQDFIATRVKFITNTQNWKSIEINRPHLAIETWRKIHETHK